MTAAAPNESAQGRGGAKGAAEGVYVLLLRLPAARQVTLAGAPRPLAPGFYLHVGRHRGGWRARLGRALRRWGFGTLPIDEFMREAEAEVAGALAFPGDLLAPCDLAEVIGALPSASAAAPAFDTSGCACPSHLLRLAVSPEALAEAIEQIRAAAEERRRRAAEGREG